MRSLLRGGAIATATLLAVGNGAYGQHYAPAGPSLLQSPRSQYQATDTARYRYPANPWAGRGYAAGYQQPAQDTLPPLPPAPMPNQGQAAPMPPLNAPAPMSSRHRPQAIPPMHDPSVVSPSPSDAPINPDSFMANPYYPSGYGNDCAYGDCGDAGCATCCGCSWFGSVGAVVMGRDNPNHVCYSFNTTNASLILLSNHDANPDWGGGVDVRFGKYLDSCRSIGVEAVYWGVYPDTGEGNAYDPDGVGGSGSDLNTALSFQSLDYNGVGNPIVGWFDNAQRHRLLRSSEWHNVEVNLFGSACGSACGDVCGDACGSSCCGGPTFTWYGGLRYFKFKDGFQFWSDDTDTTFTGSADEVYYSVNVDNHLVGFQLGGLVDYSCGRALSVYAGTKVGVYGNYMTHESFVGGAAGAAVINDATNPYNSSAYDIHSSKSDVAFLAELDLGLNYQISCRWNARLGYRAVGVTGVALGETQIPSNFGDIDGATRVDSNGSLILHGGYGSVTYSY